MEKGVLKVRIYLVLIVFALLINKVLAEEKLTCVFPVGNNSNGEGWINDHGRGWLAVYENIKCRNARHTRMFHPAYDFNKDGTFCNQDIGDPVYAIAHGKVSLIRKSAVFISHIFDGAHIVSKYAHLQNWFVKRGHFVKMGQKIGSVGNAGTVCAHLHLEIYRRNVAGLNPLSPCWKSKDEIRKAWFNPVLFLKGGCNNIKHFVKK